MPSHSGRIFFGRISAFDIIAAVGRHPTVTELWEDTGRWRRRASATGDGLLMATGGQPTGRSFIQEAIVALPVIWAGVIVVLSARGLLQWFQSNIDYGLSDDIATYIHVGMATSALHILGGLFVLGLAWRKSPRFAFWFTAWAVFVIVCDVGMQAATLFISAFVQSFQQWLMTGLFTAAGIAAIAVARRQPVPDFAPATASPRVAVGVVVLNAVIGLIVGGGLGLALGLVIGSVAVDLLGISCFEGGCGYAAVAIAFLVMIVGAIGGLVFAVVRTRRRRPAPTV
jgi:hypothetical protein